ncbi:hypothetical protein QEH40_gp01 [Microbacterium phage OscarSo]|uniref:Uncharacterized protein n=1 Tax=Microbacterium phage OscarSo TaxID=2985324 RepID=A0A9X9K343_9CAUD|nr:hypothetical protein QEH40_gp01 [Microbacterium phage OscarSo]UYL87122.1 hypothetical protein SEA_OSCARSO_1 [Microbacterium phage OscarSo]
MSATASHTEAAVAELIESGMPREHVAASLVIAGVLHLLAADPELAAMAEANDLEHFLEGCKSPAFDAKLGAALLEIRAAA